MIRSRTLPISLLAFLMLIVWLTGPTVHAEEPAAPPAPSDELQQRIDFGNTQILGQQIKSGAVYLMHRKKSDIKTMLEVRQHYREEIKADFDLDGTAITQRTAETDLKITP